MAEGVIERFLRTMVKHECTPECLTFDLAADGRIRRVEVFTQTRAPV